MTNTPYPAERRRSERGAALITALLLTTLLLAAGGALILTSSMAATTAADSTAEMQAYYAAEAGLESALAVLRRNVAPKVAGTQANFRTAVCGTAANCVNNGRNFSDWLTYTNGAVTLDTNLSYVLSVRDASLAAGAALPAAPYSPRFLHVQSIGRGPKGATKVLELTIDNQSFDFNAQAAVLMRSSSDGTNMPAANFDIGNSNAKLYSGNDRTGIAPSLPVFATTNPTDTTTVLGIVDSSKPNTVTTSALGKAATLPVSTTPSWLQDANSARAFLAGMRATAQSTGRYFTEDDEPDDIGTPSNPLFTFVDGDFSMSGSDAGGGLLIVTGTLTNNGAADYSGLILVLGGGTVQRNGGGNGKLLGGIVVARFDEDTPNAPFTAPSFHTNGGGTNDLQYDSVAITNALSALGSRVLGVVEK
jgi:hypothetical protein